MKNSSTVAITIRSFDLSGPALKKLKENCNISFINKTGARLSETDLTNALVKGISLVKNISKRRIDIDPNEIQRKQWCGSNQLNEEAKWSQDFNQLALCLNNNRFLKLSVVQEMKILSRYGD